MDLMRHMPEKLSQSIVKVVEFETGELWWVFQWLDRFIDVIIEDSDEQVGKYTNNNHGVNTKQHGRHVIRVVLVVLPLMFVILLVAISLLLPANQRPRFVQSWFEAMHYDERSRKIYAKSVLPTSGNKHI